MLFIEYFTIFSCKAYDIITDLICIIEKCQYLWNEDISKKKKKPLFFCISKCLSNKQKNIFMYTLRNSQSAAFPFLKLDF